MNVRFRCPSCDFPGRLELPASGAWECSRCDHLLNLAREPDNTLETCALCRNVELYKKKDFPHWLGLTILTLACLAFLVAHAWYHQWLAWSILIGSAAFDGLLYLCVGDVIVCYRCGAHYRGFSPSPAHQPFELGIAERYRQERLRREQLRAEKEGKE